ncbi:hypothetical protein BP00DRAFT_200804 [Aspergillus indologenus CBS 114.80]|uniref:Uncharacterized protein n=1 Tax=Aspergillus indologenus CBS 114.80 TaxID=1450541 RepID=A0A2V5I1N1_9EURO|nr:hypothetical protein BP00DRAFT_200804 [Aspergillus indologenus CBS 114.80]
MPESKSKGKGKRKAKAKAKETKRQRQKEQKPSGENRAASASAHVIGGRRVDLVVLVVLVVWSSGWVEINRSMISPPFHPHTDVNELADLKGTGQTLNQKAASHLFLLSSGIIMDLTA